MAELVYAHALGACPQKGWRFESSSAHSAQPKKNMEKVKIYRVLGVILIFLGMIQGYQFYFSALPPTLFADSSTHAGDLLILKSLLILVFIFLNPFIWLSLYFFKRVEQIQNPDQKRTKLSLFIKFYIGFLVFLFLFAVMFVAPHL